MRKVKILTIVLAIVLVTLVAFGGVYIKTQNRMENKVKDYSLGRAIEGARIAEIKVAQSDEDSGEQNTELLTEENYKIVKKTIENRLNKLNIEDYTISLNKQDGTIRVEFPEDENTDSYVYYLTAQAKVQIEEKAEETETDTSTETEDTTATELISDEMVKSAKYSYTQNVDGQYQVSLEITLTDEGQAKIQELSGTYAFLATEIDEIESAEEESEEESKEETENTEGTDAEETAEDANTESENTENQETQEQTKKIASLTIAGTEYDITKIDKNKITVTIGTPTSNTTSANNNIAIAAELEMLINAGKYPIEYELTANRYVYSSISTEQLIYFVIAVLAITVIILLIFIIKYRKRGLLTSISYIGFVSLFLLILRYANVTITIEGIGGIIVVMIINLAFIKTILTRMQKMKMLDEAINYTYKNVFSKLIPVIILVIVFCLSGWANLSSFGMAMFWGLMLMAIYNILVTKTLLKLEEEK